MEVSKKTSAKAFTLIEVMIAVAIIGILTTILLFSSSSSRAKARDARRISDATQIRIALEGYFEQSTMGSQTYPTSIYSVTNSLLSTGLMTAIPRDPQTGNQYVYTGYGSLASRSFCNGSTIPCKSYCLVVHLEQNNPIRVGNVACSASTPADTYLYPYYISR
ncbi:MAG TPA: type II secretion system protein [Candidatus Paceibacterota bacterium]|nr:type II secretion system protein [Candidatus Paceibacterota bacterium]